MKIAIQADPLDTLNLNTDTSMFIAAELTKRGHMVYFYEPQNLALNNDHIHTKGREVATVFDGKALSYTATALQILDLNKMDAILIRQNPPFDMDYITSTYLLEKLPITVSIYNNPRGLRDNPEKMIPFKYNRFMPQTIVLSLYNEIAADFIRTHNKVVLKPFYGYAGQDVLLLDGTNMEAAQAMVNQHITRYKHILLQEFLPQVKQYGDKRIILLDGEVVGALQRIPPKGSIIANMAAGGTAHETTMTARDHEICQSLKADLVKDGILLAGVDIIDGHLIEVNITSPTGLLPIYGIYGLNLASNFADKLEEKIQEKH